jgi:pimeloyl-ACP methyl ester carboxylesterase
MTSSTLPARRDDQLVADAGRALAAGVGAATTTLEAIHRAIARRAYGASGAPASPGHQLHDMIAAGVYAGVRGGLGLAVLGGARLAAISGPRRTPSRHNARAELVRAALNGAFGDQLEREGNSLAYPTTVRADHRDVPCSPDALAAAFPTAQDRIAVLVHGLCESDDAWRGNEPVAYGSLLRDRCAMTGVPVRYNSGLPIAESGRRLSALLEDLVAAWPVALTEVALVGHSMGGLVIRAACHQAAERDTAWLPLVRHAVYLGAPHGGAPLEKGAALLARALELAPESRPLAAALNSRSAGIKDLRRGDVAETHVPLAAGVRHHAVVATLGPEPESLASVALGDLLVRHGSACGQGCEGREALAFEPDDLVHLPSANHFDLLCHPVVGERLCAWLAPPRELTS